MRKFLLVIAALTAHGGPASAAADVVLANEPGGLLGPAILKYQQLNASGAQVQLKGSCTSACVMVTGIVRNLCARPALSCGFTPPTSSAILAPRAMAARS